MNGWDVLAYAMFAVLIAPLVAFAFLYWRDERRRKREALDAYTRYVEAMRQFRAHR